MIIKLHKREYKNNTLVDDYTRAITQEQYKNMVNSYSFFKGFSSSEKQYKTKTKHGLKVTKMESVSPDKTIKHVYNFSFE